MALLQFMTGFEAGPGTFASNPPNTGSMFFSTSGYSVTGVNIAHVIDSDGPATGLWFARFWGAANNSLITTCQSRNISGTNGQTARFSARFRIRIKSGSLPAANTRIAGHLTNAPLIDLIVNTTGQIVAKIGATSGTPLTIPLDEWVLIEEAATFTQNGASDIATVTFTAVGVGTTTASNSGTLFTQPIIGPFSFGTMTSAMVWDLDDVVLIGSDNGTDSVALPTATRITGVRPSGQGASAQWTGAWENVAERPTNTTRQQTETTNGEKTTFTHSSCSALGITGIEGYRFFADITGVGSATGNMLFGATSTALTLSSARTFQGYYAFGAIADATFDSTEFGIEKTGGTSWALNGILLEVLHAGTGASIAAPTVKWQHATFTYTGTGAIQTISSLGFVPDAILFLPNTGGANGAGLLWTESMAGRGGGRTVLSKPLASGNITSQGVIEVTDTGDIILGTDANCNANTVVYFGIAIRGSNSPLFKQGACLPEAATTVLVGFQPAWVLMAGSTTVVLRDSTHGTTDSLAFGTDTTVAGMITALTATGFTCGSSGLVASGQTVAVESPSHLRWYLAVSGDSALAAIFAKGKFAGTGADVSVSGLTLSPAISLVAADLPTAVDGAKRFATVHTSTTSSLWGSPATSAVGITALNTSDFTVNSARSVVGQDTHWWAFAGTGLVPYATTRILPFWGEHCHVAGGPMQVFCE